MQTVRSVLRTLGTLTAVLLAAGGPLAAVAPAAHASAGHVQQQSGAARSAAAQPLAISITGMTPTTAEPDSTVTVTGNLANHTGAALPGITVEALTSTESFQYPSQMTDFSNGTASGSAALPLQQAGEQYEVPAAVPNGATVRWSVSFPAADYYGQFGVFPIQVQVSAASITSTTPARTFLPFWPGSEAASQVKGLQVAWVWPLVDTPQQGACALTLATNDLAGSVASGGRLNTLLDAGSSWAQQDDLTWDIDPALLSDVSVMTKSYFTHGNAACTERDREQPSKAATAWLSQLKTSTAGSSAFLTPYANVDVAALSHAGLDPDLEAAYGLGDSAAGQILPGTFGKTGTGTGNGAVLKAAWPADGQADAGVLTSLVDDGGINTVILSSGELPSSLPGGADNALAKTISGVGTSMSVLLANSRITSLLGTASATASQAGQFALTQDYLAQTAMIAAELPGTSRSLVVAPPPSWDPSPAEANALLKITDQAQWLHPAGLSALSAAAAQLTSVTPVKAKQVSPEELNSAYTSYLTKVTANVNVFKDLLYQPTDDQLNSLTAALAVTESSAWRGSPGGWAKADELGDFVQQEEEKVKLLSSKKILLTGQSGETAVSVQNGLSVPIQVKVTASSPTGSDLRVEPFNGLLKMQAYQSGTVKLPLRSVTIGGTATLQLQLTTQDGSPLPWPGQSQPLSVEVTRVGRFLLAIIGGALGILVLTSAYRLRRKRLARSRNDGTADETAEAGGTG
jgi:Family of unknown function (DUF6049)